MTKHRHLDTASQNELASRELIAAIRDNDGVECEHLPDVFYPEDEPDMRTRAMGTEIAKSICQRCPIILQCGSFALQTKQEFGIWGGMTAPERQLFKRH